MAISGAVIPAERKLVFLQSSLLPIPLQPYGHTLLRDKEEKRSKDRLRTGHKRMQEMHPQQLPPHLKAPSLSAQQTCSTHHPLLISRSRNLCQKPPDPSSASPFSSPLLSLLSQLLHKHVHTATFQSCLQL